MKAVQFPQRHRMNPLACALALAVSFPACMAQAQSDAAPSAEDTQKASLNRVEITGSKIKGVDAESSVPVQTITRAQIEATSATTLDEVLQSMAISGDARNRTTGADQISYANLRGIGFGRTLVLVNGHRWVGSSDLNGTADLSSIPLSSVERIDVLKDGGSVLYGADAMVGLINVVLKDRFSGANLRAFYGSYSGGKGAQKKVELTVGHTTERFSGLLSFQYNQGEGLHFSDYELTRQRAPYGSGSFNYSDFTPAGSFKLCKGATLPSGGCAASTLADPNGVKSNFFTYDPGKTGTNWRVYDKPNDSYNNVGVSSLVVPLTQKSVVGDMSYQITDRIKLRITGQFMQASATSDAPQDFNLGAGGSVGGAGIFISPQSYYNPFGVAVGRVQRAAVEAGPLQRDADTKTRAISPTLSGDFDLWGRSFDWEVGAVHGSTHQVTHLNNDFSISRLTNALGPSFKDASGNIVCGTPGHVIAGCVPMNLLGSGTITPEMLKYAQLDPQDVGWTNNFYDHDYFAQISSPDLFKLPAGPLGFAGGIERHTVWGDTGRFIAFDNNDSLSRTRGVTGGGYGSTDVFGEFYVPLLKGLPGIQKLDLSIAGRHSSYGGGINVNNKKFGLKWKVMDDLAVRGSFSTGYRLDLSGIIQNTVTSTVVVTDPCSFTTNTNGTIASNRYAQLTPEQQTQCRAAGVPAGGYDTRLAAPTTQLNTANPQLGPERDIFRTVGFVYSPHYVPGLELTLDYWDVVFRDSIVKPNMNQMALNCLSNPGDPRLCPDGWMRRDASGAITFVRVGALNGPGGERFKGFDLNWRYAPKATSFGKFSVDMTNAILTKVIDTPITPVNKVGVLTTGTLSSGAHYRLRSNLNVNWSRGPWGARWGARYFSSQTENCKLTGTSVVGLCNDLGPVQSQTDPSNPATAKYLPFLSGGSANRIGAYTLHDISAFYQPTSQSRIKLGINNVFNKQPPFVINADRSFNPAFGVPDRYFFAEYTQKF